MHFAYIFKPFTYIQILYSQCFVYIFKVLRLYIQSIASIQTKRFAYKLDADNQRYTHINIRIFKQGYLFM